MEDRQIRLSFSWRDALWLLFVGVLSSAWVLSAGREIGATFDELILENFGACALEPRGGFSLRHSNGAWYDVVFDAVDAEG